MKSPSPLILATLSIFSVFCSLSSTRADNSAIHSRSGFQNLKNCTVTRKKAHVAFLGGSITQNAKGHTAMLPAWLEEKFPETEFTFTNAGLSSTCSVSGAFRVSEDVLTKGPVDLLVVEFAVNDDQDAAHDRTTAIRGMEGIIQQVRAHNPAADILMVHFVNPHLLEKAQAGEDSTSIAAHEAVAAHWNITTVNIARALADATEAGTMNWETYGGVHPGQEGYRFATDLMIEAIDAGLSDQKLAFDGAIKDHAAPETPLDEFSYGKVRELDLETQVAWLGGWQFGPAGKDLMPVGSIRKDYLDLPLLRGDDPGSMLYLDFHARALTAFVLAGPDAGILEISIDGGDWREVPLFHQHSKSLNYPRTVILADGLESKFHLAALRISKKKPEESTGHAASILKLSINE